MDVVLHFREYEKFFKIIEILNNNIEKLTF